MSATFDQFLKDHHDRIGEIADNLRGFEIQAKTLGMSATRDRIEKWLLNFDKLKFPNLELPLHLLEKIQFIPTAIISDSLIKEADDLITRQQAYIAPLGETIESSFKITSKLHRNQRFATELGSLLDKLDKHSHNRILFFDDFLNSGGQLVSIFHALLGTPLPNGEINDEAQFRTRLNAEQIKKFKKAEIHLYYYIAFAEGMSKVEERLKNELGLHITVHAYWPTNNHASAFGDAAEQENIREGATGKISHNSIFQNKTYKEVSEFYRFIRDIGELLLRSKETKWEEWKYADRALGYGNLGRVIITDSNIPTVTLTAIWQDAGITFNGTQMRWAELLPRTKKVLDPGTPAPTETGSFVEQKPLDLINERLQQLYKTDYIDIGVKEANRAYEIHGPDYKLLRHLFRFNLRDKNWEKVRATVAALDMETLSDQLVTLCQLALFECELRESYVLYRKDKAELVARIRKAKQFLNAVPLSQQDYEEYYYWSGRWFLETWYVGGNNDMAILKSALSCMEKTIAKKDKWFYLCYQCIILKLLKHDGRKTEIDRFFQIMKKQRDESPDQPSIRTYSITSFLLKKDTASLKSYLRKINKPTSPSDFQSTIFQHIDLVFYFSKVKNRKYKKMLRKWVANLPNK
ncbi:MAG TPA: hypothetical protein VFE04_02025 [Puia sp.]|nr:hypothetical protein [Puia sp.]